MKLQTKKPKSTYQRQQDEALDRQQMLIRMMGLRQEDMFDLIYESGMYYLSEQCRNDQAGIDILKVQSFYWNWWKQNWYQRDAEFVALHELQKGDLHGPGPLSFGEGGGGGYEYSVNEKGELMAMTLYGAYRLYHQQAMNHENLCRSYCHIMSATQSIWRKRVFNNQSI